jgi:predicted DNA-binding transcriptional regulator YafY
MRGNQLARQRRVIRAIEASPNGLTPAELAKREHTGIRTTDRDPEALQDTGFPLSTGRVERANRRAAVYLENYIRAPVMWRGRGSKIHQPAFGIRIGQPSH